MALISPRNIYYSPTPNPLFLATILPVASSFWGVSPVRQPLFLSDSLVYRRGNLILSSCPCRTRSNNGCLLLLILATVPSLVGPSPGILLTAITLAFREQKKKKALNVLSTVITWNDHFFFIRQVMMVLKLASEPVMAVRNNSAHGPKQSFHQNYFD